MAIGRPLHPARARLALRGVNRVWAALWPLLAVRVLAVGWVAGNLLVVLVAQGHLPFDRPVLEEESLAEQLVGANLGMLEVLALIGVIVVLTARRATLPELGAPVAVRTETGRTTRVLVLYGVLAVLGGVALGQATGTGPIGFHLAGTLFGAHEHDLVTPRDALVWAGYNVLAYVAGPLLVVGQANRRSSLSLPLRSSDRRNDRLVIGVVLAIEVIVQSAALGGMVFELGSRQLAFGLPLTFALYWLGTVMPTMIFVQALLVPRYLALTRSVPATVILGGVTYAALHFPEAWMSLNSGGSVLLSVIFLFLVYLGPGMVKATLTLRTGNAWVHVWAYHALVPHTLVDTPLIVRIFGIR